MVVRCKVEEITHKAKTDSIISQGMMSEAMKMMEECVSIKAEVERLIKAGDALANNIVWVELYRPLVAKWNAAKEGKGQP